MGNPTDAPRLAKLLNRQRVVAKQCHCHLTRAGGVLICRLFVVGEFVDESGNFHPDDSWHTPAFTSTKSRTLIEEHYNAHGRNPCSSMCRGW